MTDSVNFEHLKPWKNIYEDCKLAEKNIIGSSHAEILNAMRTIGAAFEKMVDALIKQAGISDAQVIQVKKAAGKGDFPRVDLYGKIMALKKFGFIDARSGNNYDEIRILRNNAVHDNEGKGGRKAYKDMTVTELLGEAERMYRCMYEESWIFANQYIKQPAIQKSTAKIEPEKVGKVLMFVLFVIIMVFLFLAENAIR